MFVVNVMAKKKVSKTRFPRRKWSRSPVQKPHSTKHGKKGYDRKHDKPDPLLEPIEPTDEED